MAELVNISLIDTVKGEVEDTIRRFVRRRPECSYVDIRLQVTEGQTAYAEKGVSKHSARDYAFSLGIRVIAGRTMAAPGFYGRALGGADIPHLAMIVQAGLQHASARARANAEEKAHAWRSLFPLSTSLMPTRLAPVEVCRDVVPARYEIDPRQVSLEEIVRCVREASQAALALDHRIAYTYASAVTGLTRDLFCSSEGACIDQTFALSEGFFYVVAGGEKGGQELYDTIGHQRGWEVLARGIDDGYIRNPPFHAFAQGLAREALELADAPPLPASDKQVVVVTDPHFNALLAHEIVGHPCELDRALKMEAAYAGRSWLFAHPEDNQIGKQIASPHLSAFSDPSLPGYGHYRYDHEGTPAKKVIHIDKGVFRGFLTSRQTAAILGVTPNGSCTATEASMVPLIRMSNTVFAPGDRDPLDMVKEVDRGYYVVGQRIPSIAESRENFRISARKIYEIRNGQVGQLFRDGSLVADSRDFFMNVDAAGTDFRLFPVSNCGKGQPMQAKRLGNGSPTLRSQARLVGP